MVFACGLSNYSTGVFHLSNHAFFKALLFLSAGSIIHAVNDEQDMRKMGGLKHLLPFTYSMVVVGSLALIGFPFLTGFYSKDLILELAFSKFSSFGYFSYFLGTFGAFLTAFYSTRLLCLTFLSEPSGHKSVVPFAVDVPSAITTALGVLAIPSIFIGFYSKDMIVGLGTEFFGTAIFIPLENNNIFDAEFINLWYKLLPVNLSILGAILSFLLYSFQYKILFIIKTSFLGKKVYNFFNRKWFFDKIYNEYFGQFFFKFGYSVSYKFVDRGIFELLGPTGLSFSTIITGSNIKGFHSGLLYHSLLFYFLGIILSFFLIVYSLYLSSV
jgi:NADH-ubiquinone oxidoreductase chain 5